MLDPDHDSLVVQAAWSKDDMKWEAANDFLHSFEQTTLDIATQGSSCLLGPIESRSELMDFQHRRLDEDQEEEYEVQDPTLLVRLREIVANFLIVNENILTETISFVAVGLDSINSVGLSRTLREQGINVSAAQLMKYSTLRRLEKYLAGFKLSETSLPESDEASTSFSQICDTIRKALPTNTIKLAPDDKIELFPATILQAGMLSQVCCVAQSRVKCIFNMTKTISSRGQLYMHTFPLRLASTVNVDRLHDSWKRAVHEFSILRTSFHFVSDLGMWAQAVHSSDDLDWTIDNDTAAKNNYRERLDRFESSLRSNDDVDFKHPPIHLRLLRPNPLSSVQHARLILVMHHALYDGFSVARLFAAVQAIYHGKDIPHPVQFNDILHHIVRQEHMGTSYWIEQLQGFERLELPRCSPIHRHAVCHTATHSVVLDSVLLEAACRRAAVTTQCLGQAVWAKLLGVLTNSIDVVFGHVVSGRNIPGAEDVIGPVLVSPSTGLTITPRS